MTTKKFKPQLITNDPMPEEIPFPVYVSMKRHGICVIIHPEHWEVLGRSLKPIKNKQFQARFKGLVLFCRKHNVLLHGEAHIDGCISDDMVHFLNTIDLDEIKKTSLDHIEENVKIGKFKHPKEFYLSLPEELKIYFFDCIDMSYGLDYPYLSRYKYLQGFLQQFNDVMGEQESYVEFIEQNLLVSKEEIDEMHEKHLAEGHEGSVIRYDKPYKFNRSRPKEFLIYKMLPQPTSDGRIIRVNQASVVDPNAEKKINELGHSVTSKKKDDRIPIEQAKDFQVEMTPEGKTESIDFGVGLNTFDTEDRVLMWKNPEKYIGRMIEFKHKEYNGIGAPKNAQFLRFREDKE